MWVSSQILSCGARYLSQATAAAVDHIIRTVTSCRFKSPRWSNDICEPHEKHWGTIIWKFWSCNWLNWRMVIFIAEHLSERKWTQIGCMETDITIGWWYILWRFEHWAILFSEVETTRADCSISGEDTISKVPRLVSKILRCVNLPEPFQWQPDWCCNQVVLGRSWYSHSAYVCQ